MFPFNNDMKVCGKSENKYVFIKCKKETSKLLFALENDLLFVIEMTYSTVGVKLVGTARHGARFVVLNSLSPLFRVIG